MKNNPIYIHPLDVAKFLEKAKFIRDMTRVYDLLAFYALINGVTRLVFVETTVGRI